MPYLSVSEALRLQIDPPLTTQSPHYYLYDLTRQMWIYIGPYDGPPSPRSVMS